MAVVFFAVCTLSSVAASFNGQNYVPLADWASANGLKTFWLVRGAEIGVTNRATRLVFDKDSRTAKINGVNVALSFPVAVDKGTPFIAQLDLDKTVRPLILPPKFADAKKSRPSASTPATAARTPATTLAAFSGITKKPTHCRWPWNCATS